MNLEQDKQGLMRNVKVLSWFNFLLDFSPYGAIAILYFAHVAGSWTLGLLVFSIMHISQSIFEIPTGIFSDFIGRKKTIMLATATSLVGVVSFAMATNVIILYAGGVLVGISNSMFSGNHTALLHDTLRAVGKDHEFAHYHGRLRSMFQFGLGSAAIVGGLIGEMSLRAVFWVSTVPLLLCLVISFFIIEPLVKSNETTNVFSHLEDALREFRRNWKLRTLSIAEMTSYGVGEAMFQFVPAFYAMLLPVWAIGLARSGSHIFAAISSWFAGRVIKRFSELRLLLGIQIFSRIADTLLYAFPTVLTPIIQSFMSLTYGVNSVSMDTLLQKEFTQRQRATMGSLTSLMGSLVFAIASVGLGMIADALSPQWALVAGSLILFPNIYLLWTVFHHERNVLTKK